MNVQKNEYVSPHNAHLPPKISYAAIVYLGEAPQSHEEGMIPHH